MPESCWEVIMPILVERNVQVKGAIHKKITLTL